MELFEPLGLCGSEAEMRLWFPYIQLSQLHLSLRQWLPGLLYSLSPSSYFVQEPHVPFSAVTAVWHRVDAEFPQLHGGHERHWWKKSGFLLAVLLYQAGYSSHAQYRILKFFAAVIVPSLGDTVEPTSGANPWKSFMTDDGNPIELSWDWHTGAQSPTIRFSIEPFRALAATTMEPQNRAAAFQFHQALLQSLSRVNVEWFDHFEKIFNSGDIPHDSAPEGHCSRIFYAFDLAEENITTKAYFFPGYAASATGQTNMAIVSQAITTAPYCTPEKLEALSIFQEFAVAQSYSMFEIDMFAIDLVDPLFSRLKIYFRNRETSFSSVRRTMTLGNRIQTSTMTHGLQNLKRLWKALFQLDEASDDAALPTRNHRTAGILYNVEFGLGNATPQVKIYIPVRHYAGSDRAILHALEEYLYQVDSQCRRYMPGYIRTLDAIL